MAPNDDDAKRATSVLTIAQIKFKQSMKRTYSEDRLPPIPVEVSSQLFSNIDAVLKQDTRVNIQKCTEWIVKHVAPSKARIAILGDYLIAVSKSIVVDQSAPRPAKKAARNRMDLLLIVSDVLHTDKFHRRITMKQSIFGGECEGFVVELISQAAACINEKGSQLELKLKAIINYWTVNRLLSAEALKTCRDRADEALLIAQGGMPLRKRNYLLPEFHGDRNAPWHDLPASYMLEQMIKHPKRPINPSKIQIQKLDKKPVSPHVRNLLDNFFEKIDLKYLPTGDNPTSETTKYRLSLDPMGQLTKKNKETGETATVANGYGWSPKFCQDMQKFGLPENIKIAREDAERMEDMENPPVLSRTRRDDRHSRPTTSSSDSDYRRGRKGHNRSRSRSHSRRSSGSYDGGRSPPRRRFRDETQGRRKFSPSPSSKSTHREFEDRGLVDPGRNSRAYGRDESQPASQWNGPNRNGQGRPGNQQHHAPPLQPQNHGQSYTQSPQPPFNAPPFPPQHIPGQFQGQSPKPMPPFGVPPPPPPQFQGPGGFIPPPPPPNFNGVLAPPPPPPNYNGAWPPLPPHMSMPSNGLQQGNQGSNQYGNQGGNQYSSQGGNQYGNQDSNQYGSNFGSSNNGQYNQNRGGFQGGRGYGSGQRGGYNGGNRGGWKGNGRGGRY